MICVCKYNRGVNEVAEFGHMNGLDGTRSANGHKNGGGDVAVVGGDDTSTGERIGGCFMDEELHNGCKFTIFFANREILRVKRDKEIQKIWMGAEKGLTLRLEKERKYARTFQIIRIFILLLLA